MKLPSPFNSLEQYFFWDDFPAYPNTIGCRIHLSGQVNPIWVDEASAATSQRHPLMRTSAKRKGRRVAWAETAPVVSIDRFPASEFNRQIIRKIDLLQENGSQVFWTADEESAIISFLTHHAAADGIGGLQVVLDWLSQYSVQAGTSEPRVLRRSDPSLLDRRSSYGFGSWKFIKKIPKQLIGLLGVWEFLRNRPVPLKPAPISPVDEAIPAGYPGILTKVVAETADLRGAAGRESVTTNDLLLTSIFSSIAEWRSAHDYGTEKDLIRIMVPINLRQMKDRYLPAANRTSLVSLDRKQSVCGDFEQLMKSIRFQMDVIQKNELGYTFLHMLNLNRWMPGGISRLAKPTRVAATVLVTNLGEPFKRLDLPRDASGRVQIGELKLERFDLIAPLRPNTQAAFAIFRYAGKVLLSMNYDNRVIDHAEAQELLDAASDRIERRIKQ